MCEILIRGDATSPPVAQSDTFSHEAAQKRSNRRTPPAIIALREGFSAIWWTPVTQAAGTVTLTVSSSGLVSLTTAALVVPPGGTLDAGTLRLSAAALTVSVGYADSLRPTAVFPLPWQGSPNVVFLGNGPTFDAGALRFDNGTDQAIDVDSVSVDLGRPGPVFDLWGSFTIPAHGSTILTQTAAYNFDTSDFPILHCGQSLLLGDPRVPKVTVTIGGVATTYYDTAHVLDTGGLDPAICPGGPNESLGWRPIGQTGVVSGGDFALSPVMATPTLGTPFTLTATVTGVDQRPVPGVTVVFEATSGPNLGATGQAVTDASGLARFTYTGTYAGTDLWQAKIPNPSGGAAVSNPAVVVWPTLPGIAISVGYADNLRGNPAFPNPWDPSPTLIFLGNGYIFDAGAIRIDNETDRPRLVNSLTLDLQRPGPVFDYDNWKNFTIPPHTSAVITQLSSFNLDTSEYPIVGCFEPVSPTDRRIPKITLTIDGLTANYLDTAHILDTFGYDLALCSGTSTLLNESLQWRPIGGEATTNPGAVVLRPLASTFPVGGVATVEAIGTDAGGDPVPNALVRFTISAGPHAVKIVESHTDNAGIARFSYPGIQAGVDTIKATMFNTTFTGLDSNTVAVTWRPGVRLTLSPSTAAQAVGSAYNATLLATDNAGQPVPNLTATFRVTAGPNAGKSGPGTTGPDGKALFTWTSKLAGTDTLEADLTLQGGATLASNTVTTTWGAAQSLTLSPLTATQPLGNTATVTALLLDGAHQPVANAPVTFQVVNGPDAGRTGQAMTDATGRAAFTLTGAGQGADTLQATMPGAVSNLVTVTWTAMATTLVYTGATEGEYSDAMALSASLVETATGRPVAGQTIAFRLADQTASAVSGADGTATVTLTPSATPGAVSLTLSFAGGGGYAGSSAALLLPLLRDETALTYTGKPALAIGATQAISARLTDGEDGAPIPGEAVTFTLGAATATATTGPDGTATATLALPATQPTGPDVVSIAFAGDADRRPARTTAQVLIYQPSSFVVWGGNTPGLALGQRVIFWGSQWAAQVTGGDYEAANPSFKGFATPANSPATLCEPTAHTTGTPLLDTGCWTSKPGNSSPPASVGAYIGVTVATSVAKSGPTIYGNVAATVVLQVDPASPYGPDPGHPGYGTVVGVIEDGAGLFPRAAARPALSAQSLTRKSEAPKLQSTSQPAVAAGSRQFFLYTQEMNLLAETELTANAHPSIANEYLWWNGHPVAQVDATGATSWTFTDHLGTPMLQTSAQQGIVWRAEYEPFGTVYALRSYDRHQPLRLPGQEAEQLGLGANGVTDRSYNVHRWYRGEWGRYTQSDPLAFQEFPLNIAAGVDLYGYAEENPLSYVDPTGESGSRPGGPYHPPPGVKTSCDNSDTCPELLGKMWVLDRMITSHTGWDRNVPRPRGGNRHAVEIAQLWVQKAKCEALYAQKCNVLKDCKPCKDVQRMLVTAGTGYLVYRCVRLLFSAPPPLWWTIPGNLAAP